MMIRTPFENEKAKHNMTFRTVRSVGNEGRWVDDIGKEEQWTDFPNMTPRLAASLAFLSTEPHGDHPLSSSITHYLFHSCQAK